MSSKRKTLKFLCAGRVERVSLKVSGYENNDRLYVGLMVEDGGFQDLLMHVTVNIPQYRLNPNEAFINGQYSKELLKFVRDNRLGKQLPYVVKSGYGLYYGVAFDMERLRMFDPEGVAEIEKIRAANSSKNTK